ncbi:MAG: hypothetical protein FJ090_18040 [Deltaproteobacteria bacterium]|nr:hypothetical protein [Deltaproteobacteria bacterium]
MRIRPFTLIFLLGALGGAAFLGLSTYDFIQHLDREVHDLVCTSILGNDAEAAGEEPGCKVALMSPYSSTFRTLVWGGIPISLPGLSVFCFLVYRGLDLVLGRREDDRDATFFVFLASIIPAIASMVMGYISYSELGTACKLCVGTYISSAVTLLGAAGAWRSAGSPGVVEDIGLGGSELADVPAGGSGLTGLLVGAATLGGFTAVPMLTYMILSPDFSKYIGGCGTLPKPEDTNKIMVALDENPQGKAAVEVLDPLCPSCLGFERRLEASGMAGQLDRKVVLFPLDNACNWNVSSAMHPGACTISEAVICAEGRATAVIDWAFENQQAIREASAIDPKAAERMVLEKFPDLKSCVGGNAVKTKLNRSMRWVVSNELPVLTPQLYVEGVKLCDADTDLGLDWALSRLLAQGGKLPQAEGKAQ